MVPQHNLKSKNIKEKSGSQSGHPVETPDKDLRRARKALPGGPGGDEKNGGSWSDARREARKESIKKGASREPKARPGGPIRLKRRRATLPHPLECSTIAAPGLSYRVRNGTGRLTRAMTTAKPRSRNDSQNTWRPFRPFNYRVAVWEPASGRETRLIVVSFSDHPNAYCRPGRSSTGKTRNQPSTRGSECCVAVAR